MTHKAMVAAARGRNAGISSNAPQSLSVTGLVLFLLLVGWLCFSARVAAEKHTSPAVEPADFHATLTPPETAWLKQQTVLRVAGPRAFPPFYFFEDGDTPQGMSLDYLTMIMGMIGLPFELEENLLWEDILQRIQDRQIDLIPCAAMVPEREAFLRFSKEYLEFPAVIIARQDAPFIGSFRNLEGLRVALIRDGAPQRWLEQQQIRVHPVFAPSTLEALQGVSLGRADACIENLATATYLIDRYGLTNLKVAAPVFQENYALHVAVRQDWPELVSIIDKAIAALTPEQHADIRNRWLSVRYEHGLRWADVVQWFLLLLLSAGVLVLFVVYWNRRLQKEIDARRDTESLLRQRTLELEEANQQLKAFSYSVSHDLRAPLRAMTGFSRTLMDRYAGNLTPDGLKLCAGIYDNANTMRRLIDALLAFSRAGRMVLQTRTVDMTALVQAVIGELRATEAGQRVDFRVGELPMAIADPNLMRQVWVNLLSNAVKFSSGKDQPVVEVNATPEGGAVVYRIQDNGAGFNMQYAHKLFGVFQRLHTATDFEGTGVGLAIVQQIVTRHGGRVWALAEPERGAVFYFSLAA